MPELNSLPGNPEVWRNEETNANFLVYFVPDTDPPVPLLYRLTDSELADAFGLNEVEYTKTFATKQDMWATGALFAGTRNQIANTTEEPFEKWVEAVSNQAATRPWLDDPEVLALIAEGMIESRPITLAEYQATQWWQTHTEGERSWLTLSVADPMTAQQRLNSNRIAVRDLMAQAGILNPPDEVIDYINAQYTTGVWTEVQRNDQIRALSDPQAGITLDEGLTEVLIGAGSAKPVVDPVTGEIITTPTLDTTRAGEERVRALLQEWLGPVYGDRGNEWIKKWAGRLRNDPDAEQALLSKLRTQRQAVLPSDDPDMSYDDLAAPWRNFWSQQWGQQVDETDPLFLDLVRTNDVTENAKMMRREGLQRGVEAVRNDFLGAIAQKFSPVRRSVI